MRNIVGTAVGTAVGFAFTWVSSAVALKSLRADNGLIITIVWLTAIVVGAVVAVVLRRAIVAAPRKETST